MALPIWGLIPQAVAWLCLLSVCVSSAPFVREIRDVTVEEGSAASLPCYNDNENIIVMYYPYVEWVSPDRTFLTWNERRMTWDTRFSAKRQSISSWNLRIVDVHVKDEGLYECQFNGDTTKVQLTVTEKYKSPSPSASDGESGLPSSTSTTTTRTGVSTEAPDESGSLTVVVEEGSTLVLPCIVAEVQLSLYYPSIAWKSPNGPYLTLGESRYTKVLRFSLERPNIREWNLHIRDVQVKDEGLYECRVVRRQQKSYQLEVKEKNKSSSPSASDGVDDVSGALAVTVEEGSTAVLPCTIEKMSLHYVQLIKWLAPDQSYLTFDDRRETEDPRFSVGRPSRLEWNLHIRDVQVKDEGIYECRVVGPSQKYQLKVKEKYKPSSPSASDDATLVTGSTMGHILGKRTIIECAVAAYPPAKVVWKKDGQEIVFQHGKYHRASFQQGEFQIIDRLVIVSVGVEDLGQYTCEAQTNLGMDSKHVDYDDLFVLRRRTTSARLGYSTPRSTRAYRWSSDRTSTGHPDSTIRRNRWNSDRTSTGHPDSTTRRNRWNSDRTSTGHPDSTTMRYRWNSDMASTGHPDSTTRRYRWNSDRTSTGHPDSTTRRYRWSSDRTSTGHPDSTTMRYRWNSDMTSTGHPDSTTRRYRWNSDRTSTGHPDSTTRRQRWNNDRTSTTDYWRRNERTTLGFWSRRRTSTPDYWGRNDRTTRRFRGRRRTSTPDYWRRNDRTTRGFRGRRRTSTPDYWGRNNRTTRGFRGRRRTSTPDYWGQNDRTTRRFRGRRRTSTPDYWGRNDRTTRRFRGRRRTSTPDYWGRNDRTTRDYWERLGTTIPPFSSNIWRHFKTSPRPSSRDTTTKRTMRGE